RLMAEVAAAAVSWPARAAGVPTVTVARRIRPRALMLVLRQIEGTLRLRRQPRCGNVDQGLPGVPAVEAGVAHPRRGPDAGLEGDREPLVGEDAVGALRDELAGPALAVGSQVGDGDVDLDAAERLAIGAFDGGGVCGHAGFCLPGHAGGLLSGASRDAAACP